MENEIFGLVLVVYVYQDSQWNEVLQLVDSISFYVFMGVVFVIECVVILQVGQVLCFVVGNFYINDKFIGVVVGQQFFGGVCCSGINDKVGLVLNLLCWVLLCMVKEILVVLYDYIYVYMNK